MANNPFEPAFIDSVDHYNDAQLTRKYDNVHFAHVDAGGRNGQCIRINQGLLPGSITRLLYNTGTAWQVGFAFKYTQAVSGGIFYQNLSDAISKTVLAAGTPLVSLLLAQDGTIYALTVGNYPLAFTSKPLRDNVWYYIEVQFSTSFAQRIGGFDDGYYFLVIQTLTISVDGEILYSNALFADPNWIFDRSDPVPHTPILSEYTGGTHRFASTGGDILIDDIYINQYSSLTSPDTTRLYGDGKVLVSFPTADRALVTGQSPWQPIGLTHFNLVNENPPDDDTSYILADPLGADVGDIDMYDFGPPVNTNNLIKFVAPSYCSFGDNEGIGFVAGASLSYISSSRNLIKFYEFITKNFDLNPTTGSPWTASDLNSLPFGVVYNGPS